MSYYKLLIGTFIVAPIFFFTTVVSANDDNGSIETRIYTLPNCPVTGPKSSSPVKSLLGTSLVSAIVVPLVNSVVDLGVNAIKEASKDKNFQLPPASPIFKDFYKIGPAGNVSLNPELGCIVIARGEFYTSKYSTQPNEKSKPIIDRIANQFNYRVDKEGNSTQLKKDNLEFYFEAATILSPSGKEFKLRPQALYLGKFVSSNGFFGPNKRDYALTLSFSKPFYEETFASVAFKFSNLKLNTSITSCDGLDEKKYLSCNESKDGFGELSAISSVMPMTDELNEEVKMRKIIAITLETASNEKWIPEKPVYAEDNSVTLSSLDNYCNELFQSNDGKAPEHQVWDTNCPSQLLTAKRTYEYEHLREVKRIEKVKADKLWNEKCSGINKTQKLDCLTKIVGDDPKTSGRFKLSATIIETRAGNKLAKALIPVAEKIAPEVKQALINKIDPVERKKISEAATSKSLAETNAQRLANLNLSLAKSEVEIAQIKFNAATNKLNQNQDASKFDDLNIDLIGAQMSLLKAQSNANDLARIAGMEVPYPDIE